jgi:hypothetical protein
MKTLAMFLSVLFTGCSGKSESEPADDNKNFNKTESKTVDIKSSTPNIPASANEQAIIAIRKLGGIVDVEEMEVAFFKNTDISGLVHLKRLTKLKSLDLWDTKVSDSELVYLKELAHLQNLNLKGTKITDAGLIHLTGLTKLTSLQLNNTKVTVAGVKKLQAALPNCKISPQTSPFKPR